MDPGQVGLSAADRWRYRGSRASPVRPFPNDAHRGGDQGDEARIIRMDEAERIGVRRVAWQSGYGGFSIGASQIETVRAYITDQEKHHRNLSIQDEFLELLRRYQIEHDERYVWD